MIQQAKGPRVKQLPIGISDFKRVIEGDYYYVDKTLFIHELLTRPGLVKLITRPRRFGKTLNLSMLNYFFDCTDNNHALFANTAIAYKQEAWKRQGKHPVIFISFRDIKATDWPNAYKQLTTLITKEFDRLSHQLNTGLTSYQGRTYAAIVEQTADEVTFETSLLLLTELLCKQYGKKVVVLLDEYDTPIQSAFVHQYYQELIHFIRTLLTATLKDNPYVELGVLTGIYQTAKEGIFSGLNNLVSYNLLHDAFSGCFGFSPDEVDSMLQAYNLVNHRKAIKDWYNGYLHGNDILYNPWSLLQCAAHDGQLRPYWVNTADNTLIKQLLVQAEPEVKVELELLLSNVAIVKQIDDTITFPDIYHSEQALWSLLFFAGYLTSVHHELIEGKQHCALAIPNKEIAILYKTLIRSLVEQVLSRRHIASLHTAIIEGDIATFAQLLQEFIINSISVFDVRQTDSENSYHLFILGLLILFQDTHEIKSNRESGFGRYDIIIIPRNPHHMGIIIEFKKVAKHETLAQTAQKALDQIKDRRYIQELYARGTTNAMLVGIACKGKKIVVHHEAT